MRGLVTLHDVAPYIHTGMNSPEFSSFTFEGFPMGGIKYFFRHFATFLTGDDFACFFDSGGSFRKQLWPGYKAKRVSNPSVNIQLEILYEILMRCGIPCYKEDGFEADDLVFNAVEKFKKEYHSVHVYSADYDLTHNVDETVTFNAVNSNVNNVNFFNFGVAIVKGEFVLLNTISAHKVFHGCSSDKIKAFSSSVKEMTPDVLYKKFCDFLKRSMGSDYVPPQIGRDKRAILIFIRDELKPVLPEEEIEELNLRVEVVYPKETQGIEYVAGTRSSLDSANLEELARVLTLCKEYQALRYIGKKPSFPLESDVKYFRSLARDLRTGAFAADRGLPLEEPVIESDLMYMRDFG